jgi:Protein of unknown function (DUF4239)
MGVLLICILIFVLFLVAGYAGLALQARLREEHKTGETKSVIGQISGLVSLLLALVLGTLIGVSWGYFSAQRTNLENFSAQILRLDQALAQFGSETKPARDRLKEGIEKAYAAIWGGGPIDPALLTVEAPLANAEAVSDYLATLQPKTDSQKAALAAANTYASMVEQSRLLISLQTASLPVPWALIAILVFWTAALFFAIGLYAERNAVVVAAVIFGALSIGFAIFLILELGMPYTGLFRVTPAALEQTIEFIDR